MSRSFKKNRIIKSGRYLKKIWWKIIRRGWKQELTKNQYDPDFKLPYELLNQYDHLDYKYICTNDFNTCWCNKFGIQKCKIK
jgi:hypothetical protein